MNKNLKKVMTLYWIIGIILLTLGMLSSIILDNGLIAGCVGICTISFVLIGIILGYYNE